MGGRTIHPVVIRQVAAITLACTAASVLLTSVITFLATRSTDLGVGLLIAVVVPLILVPAGSFWHVSLTVRLRGST